MKQAITHIEIARLMRDELLKQAAQSICAMVPDELSDGEPHDRSLKQIVDTMREHHEAVALQICSIMSAYTSQDGEPDPILADDLPDSHRLVMTAVGAANHIGKIDSNVTALMLTLMARTLKNLLLERDNLVLVDDEVREEGETTH